MCPVALARSGELRDYETVWYDGRLYDLLLSALKRAWTAYDEVKQCMKQTSVCWRHSIIE